MRTFLSGNWLLVWLCCVAGFAAAVQPAHAQTIEWMEDYSKGRETSKAADRPLIVLVTTAGCDSCRKLAKNTLADATVISAVRAGFVALRLDERQEPKLVAALDIKGYPTTIFASPDGTILHSATGFVDATVMLGHIEQAISRRRQMTEKSAPVSAPASPPQNRRSSTAALSHPNPHAPTAPAPIWDIPAQTPFAFPPTPSMYTPPAYWRESSSAPSYMYPRYSTGPRHC